MRYLPDTQVWIDYLNGGYPALTKRLQETPPDDLRLSTVVLAELRCGAESGPQTARNHGRVDLLVREVPVAEFDTEAAMVYGRLRGLLQRQGVRIGPYDLMIASHAISLGCILVTNDTGLAQVRSLEVEDWRQ